MIAVVVIPFCFCLVCLFWTFVMIVIVNKTRSITLVPEQKLNTTTKPNTVPEATSVYTIKKMDFDLNKYDTYGGKYVRMVINKGRTIEPSDLMQRFLNFANEYIDLFNFPAAKQNLERLKLPIYIDEKTLDGNKWEASGITSVELKKHEFYIWYNIDIISYIKLGYNCVGQIVLPHELNHAIMHHMDQQTKTKIDDIFKEYKGALDADKRNDYSAFSPGEMFATLLNGYIGIPDALRPATEIQKRYPKLFDIFKVIIPDPTKGYEVWNKYLCSNDMMIKHHGQLDLQK